MSHLGLFSMVPFSCWFSLKISPFFKGRKKLFHAIEWLKTAQEKKNIYILQKKNTRNQHCRQALNWLLLFSYKIFLVTSTMCERWSCTKNVGIDRPLRVAYHLAKKYWKFQMEIPTENWGQTCFLCLSFFPNLSVPASHETHLCLIWIQTVTEMPNLGELENIAWHYPTGYPGFEINFFFKGPTGD